MTSALRAIFFVCEVFLTAALFVWQFDREKTYSSSRLPLDLRGFFNDHIFIKTENIAVDEIGR